MGSIVLPLYIQTFKKILEYEGIIVTRTSIIIPAHNEEDNLCIVVPALVDMASKSKLDYEIVVVNDNSTDRTGTVCKELEEKYGIKTITRGSNPGMGNALKDGTATAKGEIVVWVMADLSDDPEVIPKFIKRIESGADLVFGSRYMSGGTAGDLQLSKRFVSQGFSMLSRILIGVPTHDITNAFRGFKKAVFMGLDIKSGDFGISPEFALKAHIAGFKLAEVPASYKQREQGVATFRMMNMGIRYFNILIEGILLRLKKVY